MGGRPGQFLDLPAFRQGPSQFGGLADDARWQDLAVAVGILRVHELCCCQKRLPGRGGRHCGDQFRRETRCCFGAPDSARPKVCAGARVAASSKAARDRKQLRFMVGKGLAGRRTRRAGYSHHGAFRGL
jgi:hypothetical protein